MDAIEQLALLVRDEGFTGSVLPDFLVYVRWWTGGVLDVLTASSEHHAFAIRAYGIDLDRPEDTTHAQVTWRQHGPVVPVVAELLTLSAGPGIRIMIRVADPRAVAMKAAELCAPELVTP